ncbi:dipeptidase [Paenibacillus ginsengihumi]|uniref:dipeptidase n=1 Tax=Paenibacillus ginsengihumi TaxID=431596 RepID=UPI00037BE8D8|nr:dipeptidase [Paenibacillus ginsengihumi]
MRPCYPVIDGHCDVLYKMYERSEIDFFDLHTAELDASYARLREGGVKLQFFAIFLPERIRSPRFDHYLEYAALFHERIASDPRMLCVKTRADLEAVWSGSRVGALLTLEGADALQDNPVYLRTLRELGVRMIGVTWNYGNWAADGVLEPRQGGFTRRGKKLIQDCNAMGILLDASHLSTRAFWDLAETSDRPFAATHSNAAAICGHPRNLDDEQLRELIRRDGRIGVTFVPWFVQDGGNADIDGILRHVEHICALGGERQLVFGSDFDGIDRWVAGMEHAGCYAQLADALSKRYDDELVRRMLAGNWYEYLYRYLPLT